MAILNHNKLPKIMMVHNFYGSEAPSGENQVVEFDLNQFKKKGHKILLYKRESDEVRNQGIYGYAKAGFSNLWNPFSKKVFNNSVNEFKPDIIHVHNTFPLISPSILYSDSIEVPVVMTLHNYRIFCPAGILMRNGSICTECIEKNSILPSIKYGCYKDSKISTIPLASSSAVHKILNTWANKIDAYFVLTEFAKKMFIKAGLPSDKIFIKPNSFESSCRIKNWPDRKKDVIFVGRLSDEKGIVNLLDAWSEMKDSSPNLSIVGDGNLLEYVKNRVEKEKLNIDILGSLQRETTIQMVADSKLLIIPSKCIEGLPTVLIEALSVGTPVAVSEIGPLPSLILNKEGISFNVHSASDMASKIVSIFSDSNMLEKMSKCAYESYQKMYTTDVVYKKTMLIYNNLIKKKKT